MKNKFNIGFITLLVLVLCLSCNYLDIVPDERPTEEDAFKDKKAAERYLYSCYAFMMKERQNICVYSHGELVTDAEKVFLQGNYSAANIGEFHYWSRMYGGIKRCYELLDNIDRVPHMSEGDKTIYKAEAKFLIAWFHFNLLRAYGPIILVDKIFPTDMPASEFPKRSKYDDCVEWIARKYDEAYPDLLDQQQITYYGRVTKSVAKAAKARLLLYAASPLTNGNAAFYSNTLLDPETKEPLMSQVASQKKWEDALEACEKAVQETEGAGYCLYTGKASENRPFPADSTEYSLRMTFMDRENMEVVWADTRKEDYYGYQNNATPRDPEYGDPSWNLVGPTLEMVKTFYTKNGLPIAEDPEYYTKNEYYQLGKYEGETTCNLNLKREPRFYSWVSFHNGWYELQRNGEQRIRTHYRNLDEHGKGSRTNNFTLSGYLIKKGVGPSFDTKNGYPDYGWPLIRMAEVYLNCAEAAVECNRLDIAKTYLNKVRRRAGIPDVEKSWEGIAVLDQDKMREIVRQERIIELCCEGHFGWDVRRWLKGDQALNHNPHGMNVNGKTDTEFFAEREIEILRKFTTPTNYFLPIANSEINMNPKIVQNPGY